MVQFPSSWYKKQELKTLLVQDQILYETIYSALKALKLLLIIKFDRPGNLENLSGCEQRTYGVEKELMFLIQDYDSFQDWFNGDRYFSATLNSGKLNTVGGDNPEPIKNMSIISTNEFRWY